VAATAGLLLAPSSASALFVIQDGKRAKTTYFDSEPCDASDTVSLTAPAGATRVQPKSPSVGETMTAVDGSGEGRGVATVTVVPPSSTGHAGRGLVIRYEQIEVVAVLSENRARPPLENSSLHGHLLGLLGKHVGQNAAALRS
jgi:hypothetical protein